MADIEAPLAIRGGPPVRTEPLPLEFPGAHFMGAEELEAVCRVVRARSPFRYYGLDPQSAVARFEKRFAAFIGSRFALGVSSGTSALSVSLAALGVGPGQEVIVPGYMWISTVSAIVRAGAIPVLAEIDDSFCMDPGDLERKITPRTTVVVPVHMSGAPNNVAQIVRVARAHDLKVLEDCAQAGGSSAGGRMAGTFGDVATFSLQLNKTFTSGEGGVVATDDEELFQRVFACHDLGYWRNEDGRLAESPGAPFLWGQGTRMGELAGAMALAQLEKLPRILDALRDRKYRIRAAVERIDGLTLRRIDDPAGDAGSFLIVTLSDEAVAGEFARAMRAEGIRTTDAGCNMVAMPDWGLHVYYNMKPLTEKASVSGDGYPWTHPANFGSRYDYGKGALPRTDALIGSSVLLAVPANLTDVDMADIIAAYRKVARVLGGTT